MTKYRQLILSVIVGVGTYLYLHDVFGALTAAMLVYLLKWYLFDREK